MSTGASLNVSKIQKTAEKSSGPIASEIKKSSKSRNRKNKKKSNSMTKNTTTESLDDDNNETEDPSEVVDVIIEDTARASIASEDSLSLSHMKESVIIEETTSMTPLKAAPSIIETMKMELDALLESPPRVSEIEAPGVSLEKSPVTGPLPPPEAVAVNELDALRSYLNLLNDDQTSLDVPAPIGDSASAPAADSEVSESEKVLTDIIMNEPTDSIGIDSSPPSAAVTLDEGSIVVDVSETTLEPLSTISMIDRTGNLEPIVENIEPIVENIEPIVENIEPTAVNIEPTVENIEPTVENIEPTVENIEPTAENIEPTVENIEPIVESIEPTVENIEPTVENIEPIVENIEPIAEDPPIIAPEKGANEEVSTEICETIPIHEVVNLISPMQGVLFEALSEGRVSAAVTDWGIVQDHVKYQLLIQVQSQSSTGSAAQLMLLRRYSDFAKLYKQLFLLMQTLSLSDQKVIMAQLPSFPAKRDPGFMYWCWSNPSFIKDRQKSLEAWINAVLEKHSTITNLLKVAKDVNGVVVDNSVAYEASLHDFLIN